ncbi:ubiquitin-like domain-containing protein [Aeromicrobium endophyticum]|uniref:ubiquitin-like domain-containing protein n=1 Tax=Aeromicrobium endophyticum TaxID=2292704 RepID=UPI0011C3CF68|nr:resuscitation-promoting factor [Aeromicrobium endophyticum]
MLHQNTSTSSTTKPHGHRAKRRRRKSTPILALNLAVVLVLAGGTAAYGALSQTITLSVDGKRDTVRTFGGTVADVLDDHGVVVRDGDRLNHRPTDPISDGDTIDVAYARPLQLTVDGVVSDRVVFEPTVGRALTSLGVAPAEGSYVSAKAAKPVPRSGMRLVVSTPKNVTVVADGQAKTLTTTRPTVADVLDEAGVTLDADDEIQPGVDAYVAPDEKLRVVRIEKVQKTETVKIKHDTEVKDDPEALAGETEVVTPGKNGKNREQVTLVYADGKLRDRVVVASDPVSKPVTEVVSRGTSRTPPDSVWDKIAQCESGGNWKINSGNGYYGGLQFSAATWKSVGGPGLPHENSREVQIKYAKILQARSGWGQWGCAGARFN